MTALSGECVGESALWAFLGEVPAFTGEWLEVDIPAVIQDLPPDAGGRLNDSLVDQFDIEGISISRKRRIVRVAMNDPSQAAAIRAAIEGYSGAPTPLEIKIQDQIAAGMPILKSIWQKPIASQTAQEKAINAISALLLRDRLEELQN